MNKELAAALDQVGSYALLLSAKYAVIASQEGIWITTSNSRYRVLLMNIPGMNFRIMTICIR